MRVLIDLFDLSIHFISYLFISFIFLFFLLSYTFYFRDVVDNNPAHFTPGQKEFLLRYGLQTVPEPTEAGGQGELLEPRAPEEPLPDERARHEWKV